jgi:rhodanese-related sulfurtransferase
LDLSLYLEFLQKNPWHLMLFGTAVVTGGMLLWPLVNRLLAGSASQVGALEAVQLINRRDALVLDVRDKADFAAGHIPNARNIPLAELSGRLREIEKFKSRPIVVNCPSGTRPAGVCTLLGKNGFGEVFALNGGLRGWVEASLPVEK